MKTLSIEYPESLTAVKLFEIGRLTSGQAASLAGVGRVEFPLSCRRFGAPSVNWDKDELHREFDGA